jgi:hypothetical protein
MRSFLSELTKRMTRGSTRREVACDGEGFSVLEGSVVRGRVLWSEVIEVFAYKMDLFSVDEICVGFRLDDSGTHCWVSEEFRGYKEVVEQLRMRFPGIREDWFSDVAFPAFAENRTTLWGRPWSPIQG